VLDVVVAKPAVVGSFLARVALMELISTGAVLTALSCTFCVGPALATEILAGVYAEAKLLHHAPGDITVVTTEKNMPTRQTGVGITCVGLVRGSRLRVGQAQIGDLVVALGVPKVGPEVALEDPDNATLPKLIELLHTQGVRDIAPAGSKGILYEAQVIADSANLRLALEAICTATLHKSAGPATALVFACTPAAYVLVALRLQPLMLIGTLHAAL